MGFSLYANQVKQPIHPGNCVGGDLDPVLQDLVAELHGGDVLGYPTMYWMYWTYQMVLGGIGWRYRNKSDGNNLLLVDISQSFSPLIITTGYSENSCFANSQDSCVAVWPNHVQVGRVFPWSS